MYVYYVLKIAKCPLRKTNILSCVWNLVSYLQKLHIIVTVHVDFADLFQSKMFLVGWTHTLINISGYKQFR